MLKFLIILGIAAYVIYKVGSFLFKIGAASQQFRSNQNPGNIHANGEKKKKKPNIHGEFIDYEEVK